MILDHEAFVMTGGSRVFDVAAADENKGEIRLIRFDLFESSLPPMMIGYQERERVKE